jgi:uncharacterized protein YoxC
VEITEATVIWLGVVLLINTLFIAGIAVALFLVNKKLNDALAAAKPVLDRATQTLGKVEDTTLQLQQRVDKVLEKTTTLVEHVTERVDTTTAIAEEAVTEPLIGAASLMAGINRGLRTYSERRHEKGEGRDVSD